MVGGVYAIINNITGRKMLSLTTDIQGSSNRFKFSQSMNSCLHHRLKNDWNLHGGQSFRFQILETIEKKEDQTDGQFMDDIKELYEMTAPGIPADRYE